MAKFDNCIVKVYSLNETSALDAYGNPRHGYTYTNTYTCDMQSMSPSDSLREFGEILQDTYKIYFDSTCNFNPSDILMDEKGDTYKITGTPINNTRFNLTSHIKLVVQKTNKPIRVIE